MTLPNRPTTDRHHTPRCLTRRTRRATPRRTGARRDRGSLWAIPMAPMLAVSWSTISRRRLQRQAASAVRLGTGNFLRRKARSRSCSRRSTTARRPDMPRLKSSTARRTPFASTTTPAIRPSVPVAPPCQPKASAASGNPRHFQRREWRSPAQRAARQQTPPNHRHLLAPFADSTRAARP